MLINSFSSRFMKVVYFPSPHRERRKVGKPPGPIMQMNKIVG